MTLDENRLQIDYGTEVRNIDVNYEKSIPAM
jgi:hypothetical protein